MKKLKSTRGETLVETLVSLLIIVLTFAFLTTSAITAAKINAKVRQRDVSFRYSDAQEQGEATLTLRGSGNDSLSGTAKVQLYEENGYLYYTAGEDTP